MSSLPHDCNIAIRPPAATPPPLKMAKYAISLAAMEPAAIPPAVKPKEARRAGVRTTVVAPPEQEHR